MSRRYMGCERPRPGDAGCWVMVRLYTGSVFAGSTHCAVKPRPGALTCRYHTQYERAAQETRDAYRPERIERQRQSAMTRIAQLEAKLAKEQSGELPRDGKFGPSATDQALSSERRRLERIEAMEPIVP